MSGLKTAFVATYIDLEKRTLREVLCVAVPEVQKIRVNWSKSELRPPWRKPSEGLLVYKPWPEEDSSLFPGVETGNLWELILSGDEVELL